MLEKCGVPQNSSRPTQTIHRNSKEQKELLDTITNFEKNYSNDITNGIANRLLHIMDTKNFPVIKLRDIYAKLKQIDKGNQSDKEKELAKQEVLNNLTDQEINSLKIYIYNSHFWNTHLKDGNKLNDLVLFQPNKRPEKIEWMEDILKAVLDLGPLNKLSSSIVKKISDILERGVGAGVQHTIEIAFHPNILEMSPEEENMFKDIINGVKNGKKYFILLNHETFANIPITIVKFMQVAHKLGIKNVNKYFTTIIGPLIATHKKQIALINSLSSVLVTHPADNKIDGAKSISSHQQCNAKSQIENDFDDENPKGQIYFCAPSGTRDIVHYGDNGIPQIFIPDASWGSNRTTGRMIGNLHRKNPDIKFYAISTNTTELKKPNAENGVSPNNNKWNKHATVDLHINKLDSENLSTENFISTILKGLNDLTGNHATTIPPDIFNFLKKLTKTDEEYKQTGQLPKRFFNSKGELDLNIVRKEMTAQKN